MFCFFPMWEIFMYLKASLHLNLFPVFPRLLSCSLGNTISKQIAILPCHSFWTLFGYLWQPDGHNSSSVEWHWSFSLSYLSGFTKFTLNLSRKSVFLFSAVFIRFLSVLVLYWCCLVLRFFKVCSLILLFQCPAFQLFSRIMTLLCCAIVRNSHEEFPSVP